MSSPPLIFDAHVAGKSNTPFNPQYLGFTRILFGTDSTVFPRGWRRDIFDSQLKVLTRMGLSRLENEAILYGNLAQLL